MKKDKLTAADLAVYLGQEFCLFNESAGALEYERNGILVGIRPDSDGVNPLIFEVKTKFEKPATDTLYYKFSEARILLRPLSDLTEVEAQELHRIVFGRDYAGVVPCDEWFFQQFTPAGVTRLGALIGWYTAWRYLLSIGIDLFGWIDAGLAIDKTKLQTP